MASLSEQRAAVNICFLLEISGFSWCSVQRILTEDLGKKRVVAKFVPRALTDNQKECRVETCCALKQQLETDPDFLSKVIAGDESWCYGYDPKQMVIKKNTSYNNYLTMGLNLASANVTSTENYTFENNIIEQSFYYNPEYNPLVVLFKFGNLFRNITEDFDYPGKFGVATKIRKSAQLL
ncbi:hypothetical protein NQ318_018468 [Aromia moschata]|uniref:Uncharacterized protein n=1 Tax=Aromia moschata TaxID=1265417 RepID=A0AAV8YNB0_9CUCU|nr:hypothetical protein NQ318_018468 [Aromia moschata]